MLSKATSLPSLLMAGRVTSTSLLLAKPSTYNLPENPKVPQRNVVVDSLLSIGSAVLVGLGALLAFRDRGKGDGGGHA